MNTSKKNLLFNIFAILTLAIIAYVGSTTSNKRPEHDANREVFRDEKLGLELSYPKLLKAGVDYTYNSAPVGEYEDPNTLSLPVQNNTTVATMRLSDGSMGYDSGIFVKVIYDTGFDTSKVDPNALKNIEARNLPNDTFYKRVGDFLIEFKMTYFTFEQKEILYDYAESLNIIQYHKYDEFDPEIGMSRTSYLCPEIDESTDTETFDTKVRLEKFGLEIVYPGEFSFVIEPTERKELKTPVSENYLINTFGISQYFRGFIVTLTYNTQNTQGDDLEQLLQPEFKGFKDHTFNKKTKDFNLAFNYHHVKGYSNNELYADTKEIKVTQYDEYDPTVGMSKKYNTCLQDAYKETDAYKTEESNAEIREMHLKELKERTRTQEIK